MKNVSLTYYDTSSKYLSRHINFSIVFFFVISFYQKAVNCIWLKRLKIYWNQRKSSIANKHGFYNKLYTREEERKEGEIGYKISYVIERDLLK